MKNYLAAFVAASLLAFILQVYLFSPISNPEILRLPPRSSLPTNKKLQEVRKLGEGFLQGPEDVCVDKNGVFFTAVRDGWIKKMHKNETWQNWKKIESDSLLGITASKNGGVIVCDDQTGLLKVTEDGVTVLASYVNGSKIRFADKAIEASDGNIYFSVPSTKFGYHNWYLDVLEARPHGQMLKYDPTLNETTVFLDDLSFPNGVALPEEEDYLVFCESWKFRCLKHWLKGENKGKTEVFVDNLPGGPDNINLAPDGSFWIGLLQVASDGLEFVHSSKLLKHLIASSPKLIGLVNGVTKKAMVVNVAADGKIIRKFDDPDGKVMSFVTSAMEYEDHLYLGSLYTDFIGKLPI
ncbi:protein STRICTOSIDINE SYNTHASE-LIKE 4-like [Mercurialis annua]|uniref:protein STRICTOSIDINE SYNTHASE-LIKE 4-like n=1 Tax=Mercurialis annua TaxID=3986 RepID=UPI00215F9155|nr:protein STRICTOSIDINE SYNTHASE-LIKE 4-like [Mercurialis annua]